MTPDPNDASPFPPEMIDIARALLTRAEGAGLMIATAESCTGGLVTGLLTEIPGSSAVIERGYVTYSNVAKSELLGVPEIAITQHGAVSPQVAQAMAEGALARSRADVAVSITGVAGPSGGAENKPVGLVWFGLARRGAPARTLEKHYRGEGRSAIRLAAVETALELLSEGVAALTR